MKRLHTRVPGSIPKSRLDHFLMDWLPVALGEPISRTQIRALLFGGAVYVNRHRNKDGMSPVFSGATIEVYYDAEKVRSGPARIQNVRFDTDRIVFEDEWLLIVDKPAGIPTQPTVDPFRTNLYGLIQRFLTERDGKPEGKENAYVGLHHRLDRDTSGLVLFTKREDANKGVSDLFLAHRIQKTYQCMVWRAPQAKVYQPGDRFKVENFLGRVNAKNENTRFGEVRSGGDYALTQFRVIEAFRDMYWLEAQPQTGRTHQIRVHCAEVNLPILGDSMYFPENLAPFIAAPRLLLHAYQLEFNHPMIDQPISVTANLPEEFMQVLGTLRS